MRVASKDFSGYRGAATSSKPEEGKPTDLPADLNRLRVLTKFEQELNNNVSALKTELHEQRLKELKELANTLKEDSWKYPPVDKLLGL